MTRHAESLALAASLWTLSLCACSQQAAATPAADPPKSTAATPAADSPCAKLAKNLAPLLAVNIKGMDAKPAALKAMAAKVEPRFTAKCEASPEKASEAVACLIEGKTLGAIEKCRTKPGWKAVDGWGDEVGAELKRAESR
jgi:hypothetical protein